jgi:hypothetical protein
MLIKNQASILQLLSTEISQPVVENEESKNMLQIRRNIFSPFLQQGNVGFFQDRR